MTHALSHACAGMAAVLAITGMAGCGVSSEDEPQPLEQPLEQPRVNPTVRSSTSPTQTVTSTTTSPPPPVTETRPAPMYSPQADAAR